MLALNQDGAAYSYLYDGKGNVTTLLDGNTKVAAAYQYDPFGRPRGPVNTLSQPMQFSTKPYDEKTGFYYYGYRFYGPVLGRWLIRDPIGEVGGINLYGFVDDNPVNTHDPDGRIFPAPLLIPAAVIGIGAILFHLYHQDCHPMENPEAHIEPNVTSENVLQNHNRGR